LILIDNNIDEFAHNADRHFIVEKDQVVWQGNSGELIVDTKLKVSQQQRQPITRKIVHAANTSADWYEDFRTKMQLLPLEFALDYLTRSGRIDMERLRGFVTTVYCAVRASPRCTYKAVIGDSVIACAGVPDTMPGTSKVITLALYRSGDIFYGRDTCNPQVEFQGLTST
jgi:hypothetical protein